MKNLYKKTLIILGLILIAQVSWAAISDTTKIDLGFKFNQLKQFSTTAKQFYEEATNRFTQTDHDQIWLASLSTSTSTEATAGRVTCTNDLTMTEDTSVSLNKSWTTGLRGWVPPFYGTNWTVRIYENSGGVKGTEILTTDAIDWFFDYAEGRFTAQSTVAGKSRPLHIQGCYYTGPKLSGSSGSASSTNPFIANYFVATSSSVFSSLPYLTSSGIFASNLTATQATSTSLGVLNLSAASCDVKSTTGGSLYCGTDATGAGGSGNVATSTAETAGNLSYWTSTASTPATLGKVATTSVSCSGSTSCTSFTAIGGSPITISSTGANSKWATSTDTTSIYPTNATKIGIGTSTPSVELSVVGPTNPEIRIGEGNLASYFSIVQHAPTRTQLTSTNNGAGTALIDFDPIASDGSSAAALRMLRLTNTTGETSFTIHKGDGTATNQHFFRGNGSSFMQNDSGTLSLGPGTSVAMGTAMLSVKGNAAIGSTFYDDTTPTNGLIVEGSLGIGTTTPYAKLSVVGEAVAARFTATTSVASVFPYASTTVLSANVICLTGDSCQTAWPVGGAGAGNSKWATSTIDTSSIYNVGLGAVGIGTTTPRFAGLEIATTTKPQLKLTGGVTDNAWNFRNAGGILYISTSSPTTFATSSVNAIKIDSTSNLTANGINASSLTVTNGITVSSFGSSGYVKNTAFGVLSGGNGLDMGDANAGTLAVARGGTGHTSGYAVGDLMVGNNLGTLTYLAIGSLGQVLTIDNNATVGLNWITPTVSDWNKQTNFGALALTPTTTIPIWAKSAIYASSTLQVAATTTLLATTTIASSTPFCLDGSLCQTFIRYAASGTVELYIRNQLVQEFNAD